MPEDEIAIGDTRVEVGDDRRGKLTVSGKKCNKFAGCLAQSRSITAAQSLVDQMVNHFNVCKLALEFVGNCTSSVRAAVVDDEELGRHGQ